MSVYHTIKTQIKMSDVINKYDRLYEGDRCRCPFHNDTNPSMKVYDDHVFCFACGSYADATGYMAKSMNISNSEAAKLLCEDFSLTLDKSQYKLKGPVVGPKKSYNPAELKLLIYEYLQKARFAFECLRDRYAPYDIASEEGCDERFVTASSMLPKIEYYLEFFYTGLHCPDEVSEMIDFLMDSGEMTRIKEQIAPFYESSIVRQYMRELRNATIK